MEYTQLGKTGLRVSKLALGTFNFGPFADADASFALMNAAVEAGINLFDTADVYNFNLNENSSESIIGRWLAEDPARRRQIVLATKLYLPTRHGVNERGTSAYHIAWAVEDSLKRLQTDHIDLLQFHHVDRNTPWEEFWQAMERLIRDGKVLYVGGSNIAAWEIAQANCVAEKRHLLGLVSDQSPYNLTNRTIELEVLPACKALGVGTIPYSPLAGGKLAGVLKKAQTEGRRSTDWVKGDLDKYRTQIEQYEALCEEIGLAPAKVALAWVLSRPDITAPIIGPRTVEQLRANVETVETVLDDDVLQRLDEIWPGPGGQAPEAYAW